MQAEVIVHNVEQARSVLSAAKELGGAVVQLRSAPGAAAYAGVGYLFALGKAVNHELIIDVHDDAAIAMAALRAGCRKIQFSGSARKRQALTEMAHQLDARIINEPAQNRHCLMLSADDDAGEITRNWLHKLQSARRALPR